MLQQILEMIRDLDGTLTWVIKDYGVGVYALLFAIIFAETGLVVTPFLPGDSLLFVVGALAARGSINGWAIAFTLIIAAILGDAVNYQIGKYVGPRLFRCDVDPTCKPKWWMRLFNRKHLERAHQFYETYGGKAVVLGRFVPIVRTFVPFVAGAGAMTYSKFFFYNVFGALLWIGVCMGAGLIFGSHPWVKEHFEAVVIGIIVVSVIPVVVEFILQRRRSKAAARIAAVESAETSA